MKLATFNKPENKGSEDKQYFMTNNKYLFSLPSTANSNDLDIAKLGERKQDIYFDIIHDDYVKIIKEIEKKKKRQGFTYDKATPKQFGQVGRTRPKLLATNNNSGV